MGTCKTCDYCGKQLDPWTQDDVSDCNCCGIPDVPVALVVNGYSDDGAICAPCYVKTPRLCAECWEEDDGGTICSPCHGKTPRLCAECWEEEE
jgi:hypothetical protein